MPLFGDRRPYPFIATEFVEIGAKFSPDGAWVAYTSNESGGTEVYVRALHGPQKLRISSAGGQQPRWLPNGKELLYIAPGNLLKAAEIQLASALTTGVPKVLFRTCSGSHTLRGTEELRRGSGREPLFIRLRVTGNEAAGD